MRACNIWFGEFMKTNIVLKTIMERRSNLRFKSTLVSDEKLNSVLEAGRWAPSWTNSQPWRFIVVKEKEVKDKIGDAVASIFNLTIKDAPVCIVTCVNTHKDPFHFVEDGAIATQNMALATQSLGLGTSWIGIFSLDNEKNSSERKVKEILRVPNNWRIISILPIGVPMFEETRKRKELSELLDFDVFQARDELKPDYREKSMSPADVLRVREPSSAREIEPALV
jgi:nitroreductase